MELISYLDNCFKNDRLIRWPESCMPLKIYIAPFRWYKAKKNTYTYQEMVRKALDDWTNVSHGKISFKIVNTLNESQINLDWRRVDRNSLGHCYFHFDKLGRLYSAEIQIGLSDGIIHAQYQDENEVFHTIIHEIGHAIGLDHSPFKNDIMYVPHQYGVVEISPRDALTLKWLYRFPYGKTKDEILTLHNFSEGTNLDSLIYQLEKKELLQESNNPILLSVSDTKTPDLEDKNLIEEQELLAEINKYNLSLQNITISPDIHNYLRKNMIPKDPDK